VPKKTKQTEREILKRIEERRFDKRLAEKAAKKIRNRRRSNGVLPNRRYASHVKGAARGGQTWHDLQVPKVLDLGLAKADTCQLFTELRTLVRRGLRVRLIFMETVQIAPEALIFMLGQVQRLRLEYGESKVSGTYPASKKVERLMEESGFFQVLGVKKRGAVIRKSSATRYLKCKSNTEIVGAEIPKIRDELLGSDLRMPPPIGKKVFRALTEAMTNVKHHAYFQKTMNSRHLDGRWWMAAQLSVKKNLFTLTFYDAGVGIPRTLPRRYGWETIRGAVALLPGFDPDDGQMIKAAVELGRTRTGEDNRGKGLLDLLKLIDTVGGGALQIFSRRGVYKYTHSSETFSNDDDAIEGTLIKWEMPLNLALTTLKEVQLDDLDD
jgi:hypothetical protein